MRVRVTNGFAGLELILLGWAHINIPTSKQLSFNNALVLNVLTTLCQTLYNWFHEIKRCNTSKHHQPDSSDIFSSWIDISLTAQEDSLNYV